MVAAKTREDCMRLWIGLTVAAAVTIGSALTMPAQASPLLPVAAANAVTAAEPADVTPVHWYRHRHWHWRHHRRHRHWR